VSQDYSQYQGKKVIVTVKLKEPNAEGALAEEIEGTAEAANNLGIMLKPKGKVSPQLIEAGDIEEIKYAPEKAKKLSRKTLKPVTFGDARQHLFERHGIPADQLENLDEEAALKAHSDIDHEKLGHYHGVKETKAESAIAAESAAAEEPAA
jgi:hypothetical protein